ncbi:hypothetical protein ONE63_007626 [Megalurothrips usitatus]|uniref:COMM domain-containing protein 5 n=1 Tax=Megalurothrips usitatus TaxID=439358 RepID=A0AAV7XRT8_9NEOP|nr:hypothetical protein ONE63_007626 [Megalurothrips usitatus]
MSVSQFWFCLLWIGGLINLIFLIIVGVSIYTKESMSFNADELNIALLQLAANYVYGCTEIDEKKRILAVKNAAQFGQILPIVESYIKAPNENSSVADLSDGLKHLQLSSSSTEKCIDMLKNLKCRVQVDNLPHQEYFPTLSNMKWRVDITISSSMLSRVLDPSIVIELELSNGQKITFESTVSRFHKLRYTVASILKDMDSMNNRMSAIKV